MIKVEIGDRSYVVDVASSDEEKMEGLQNVEELPENKGLLFIYDYPETVDFWMKDTPVSLDIVFINEFYEVISVATGEPFSEEFITEDNVLYVLEVNANSGIKAGDDVDIEDVDESSTMQVLGPDGEVQMLLSGGERIFSRSNTKALVKLAKKAYKSQSEKDYKALGKRAFKYLDIQDSNDPEFVEK